MPSEDDQTESFTPYRTLRLSVVLVRPLLNADEVAVTVCHNAITEISVTIIFELT